MMHPLLDVIVRASRLSLRELSSRTDGDTAQTAAGLARLLSDGAISLDTGDHPSLTLKTSDKEDRFKAILDEPDVANQIFVQPTATGFRQMSSS
jgi:hypothetical protein